MTTASTATAAERLKTALTTLRAAEWEAYAGPWMVKIAHDDDGYAAGTLVVNERDEVGAFDYSHDGKGAAELTALLYRTIKPQLSLLESALWAVEHEYAPAAKYIADALALADAINDAV
ncbi:hypothetical protein [Agromyces humi]|uniref:hypothetical protein n=1 Tax=Agromyces humi TaxID=1766800 RepID=UPI00135CCB12|nr:hypothetical protein [Agromyces humi]